LGIDDRIYIYIYAACRIKLSLSDLVDTYLFSIVGDHGDNALG